MQKDLFTILRDGVGCSAKSITANADGYGKWANLPISNNKGFDHLLYPMLAPALRSSVFLLLAGCFDVENFIWLYRNFIVCLSYK